MTMASSTATRTPGALGGSKGRAPMLPRPPAVHGRVFTHKERCKGCELCIEFCPKNVLARSKDFNAKGYHYPVATNDGCINCRLCVTVCPEYAIFSVPAVRREDAARAATQFDEQSNAQRSSVRSNSQPGGLA